MEFNYKFSLNKILTQSKKRRIKELDYDLDNILFLDYDGVLNIDQNNFGDNIFNQECISNLNKLCHKYNLKIVVISSWRKYSNYKEMLYESGLDKDISILGKTDNLNTFREIEIKKYLYDNYYIGKFIILDDGIFNELSKYQIKTQFKLGFNNEKYLEAERLLESL